MAPLVCTAEEYDALIAGLKLLAQVMRAGQLPPAIEDLLTDHHSRIGLTADAVDAFADRLLHS